MKKLIRLTLSVIVSLFMLQSCSTENVPEGNDGIVVSRPYIFGSSGVTVVSPGRHVLAWSSDIFLVNTRPKKYKESFDNLNTKDDVPVDFDIFFNLQVISGMSDSLYSNFGISENDELEQPWYINNLKNEFRDIVRNKCKDYEMNPLTNSASVSNEVVAYVLSQGNKYINSKGIPVLLLNVSMGKVNPPKPVIEERSKTAEAKQKEKTIAQEIINETKRKFKEEERAKADKAYQKEMGFTTAQYIQTLKLENDRIMANKTSKVIQVTGGSGVIVDTK